MNVIPLASFKVRDYGNLQAGDLKYIRFLYTANTVGSSEDMMLYVSDTISTLNPFNPYSFTLSATNPLPSNIFVDGFWNSNSHPTCKGHPRLFEGIYPIDSTNAKFIALIGGDVGTTVSKREVGIAHISSTGEIYSVSQDSMITCATGESILGGSVVPSGVGYAIFLVRKLADDSTRVEQWFTMNLTLVPTLYKTVDVSTNHATNKGSIYNGGFVNVNVFDYNGSLKMMVSGISNYLYSGLTTPAAAEGIEQVTTVGWYDYIGQSSNSDVNYTSPDFVPSIMGPVIMPYPITSESYDTSSRKMLGVKGNIVVFSEGGRNYIITGFSGYKYVDGTTYDSVKTTVWIHELNLL